MLYAKREYRNNGNGRGQNSTEEREHRRESKSNIAAVDENLDQPRSLAIEKMEAILNPNYQPSLRSLLKNIDENCFNKLEVASNMDREVNHFSQLNRKVS